MYKSQDEFYRNSFQFLKCLKCGSYKDIEPISVSIFYNKIKAKRIKRKSKYSVNSLAIPTCPRCNYEFKRWKRFQHNLKRQFFINLVYFFISSLFVWSIWRNFVIQISFSIIFIITIIIISVNSSLKLKHMEYNPLKFFHFTKDGYFRVKNEYRDWIAYLDWIKETIYERVYLNECEGLTYIKNKNTDYIKCVYCGAKVRVHDVKCFKCNRLLPII